MTVINPNSNHVSDAKIETSTNLMILGYERDSAYAIPGGKGVVTLRFQLSRPPTTIEVEEFNKAHDGLELEAGYDAADAEWDSRSDATHTVKSWNRWLNDARLSAINRISREAEATLKAETSFNDLPYRALS